VKIIFCDGIERNLDFYRNIIEKYESPYIDAVYTSKLCHLVEYCREQSPDIVVTEIFPLKQKVDNQCEMQNTELYDALDVIKKIKSETGKDICFIISSENKNIKYVIKALNCGANKYLEKPINCDAFLDAFKEKEEKLFSEIAIDDAWSLKDERKALNICNCVKEIAKAYSTHDILAFASHFNKWKNYTIAINSNFFLRYFGTFESDRNKQLEIIENKLTELFCLSNDAGISRKILKYVDDNMFLPQMSLDMVASTFCCSSSTISIFFKNVVNTNFSKYIQEHRMAKAKKLLLTTNKTVKEISLECGYSYTNYFIKKFVQKEGMTPSFWRKAK